MVAMATSLDGLQNAKWGLQAVPPDYQYSNTG